MSQEQEKQQLLRTVIATAVFLVLTWKTGYITEPNDVLLQRASVLAADALLKELIPREPKYDHP